MYTDTEGVGEKYVQPFDLDKVFDFDLFYDEVSKHMGYIRYWNAENKLMKLCKTIYSEYTPEKAVQVLSKILKRKLDGVDIIDQYPTEMNYEPSNASSLNWDNYNEYSDEAPFAVNFLFYTISLMNGNEDSLQAYFYRQLIKRMHSNRYADIDVSSIIDRSYMLPVNYSVLSISPIRIDPNKSSIPIQSGIYGFYGMTFLTDNLSNMFTPNPYRYTFNMYENEKQYPLITENDYTEDSYLGYTDITAFNANTITYRHDIYIARLLTRYIIACYEFISNIQTYYKHSYNANEDIINDCEKIDDISHEIGSYAYRYAGKFINPATMDVAMSATNSIFASIKFTMANTISSIRTVNFNGRTANIERVAGGFLQLLESVYKNTGFDDAISKRVRNLYIHFKKINGLQSVYDFLKWVEGIDLELIQNLDSMRSENDNDINGANAFAPYVAAFTNWLDPNTTEQGRNTAAKVRGLKTYIDNLFSSNYTSHFKPIIDFCEDIIENWIFDYFILDSIEYDKTISYNQKPYAIIIDAPAGDRFHPKKGQIIDVNSTMIFEPIVENTNNGWIIKDISKICEYAFFLGTDLNVSMRIVSQSGSTIDTISGTMKFFRIGSSADDMVTFNQFPNMKNSCIDIQNVHEDFEVNSSNHIVNRKFAKMNYELLVGNSYCQLDHTSELILERKTMLQGSVDRIYLPGYLLNKLSAHEFGQHTSFEANYPEFGTRRKLGMFAGPGFAFGGPFGSVVKIVPFVNYKKDFGIGGLLKYVNTFNRTEFGYGTSNDIFFLKGRQQFDDNLYLHYGINSYSNEWFLGGRMAKYMAELVYDKSHRNKNFLAEGLDLTFRHRIGFGLMQDDDRNFNGEKFKKPNDMSTTRTRYMAEINQSLYKYENIKNRTLIDASVVLQGSAALYGTGDTQFVARIGPRLKIQYKNWMQDLSYYISGYDDKTPMPRYDAYRYGKQSVRLTEAFRLNKYISVGWSGYVNLSDDAPNGKMFQENAFLVSLGPDDLKVIFGYDFQRQRTYFGFNMAFDPKGTVINYDKMTIKNPERLGKTPDEQDGNDRKVAFAKPVSAQSETTKKSSKNTKPAVLQYAQVIDIEDPDRERID